MRKCLSCLLLLFATNSLRADGMTAYATISDAFIRQGVLITSGHFFIANGNYNQIWYLAVTVKCPTIGDGWTYYVPSSQWNTNNGGWGLNISAMSLRPSATYEVQVSVAENDYPDQAYYTAPVYVNAPAYCQGSSPTTLINVSDDSYDAENWTYYANGTYVSEPGSGDTVQGIMVFVRPTDWVGTPIAGYGSAFSQEESGVFAAGIWAMEENWDAYDESASYFGIVAVVGYSHPVVGNRMSFSTDYVISHP